MMNSAAEAITPTGRTAPPELRRRQLIDATIACIARRGILGTTMSSIAREAGLSAGLASFHFDGKENLLEEALRFLAMEHRNHWKSRLDGKTLDDAGKILAIVDAHFEPVIFNYDKIAVWAAFYGEAGYRARYRRIVQDLDDERLRMTTEILERLIAHKNSADADAEEVAEMLEALYDGFWHDALVYHDVFEIDFSRNLIYGYLAIALPDHFERPKRKSP